MLAGGLSGHMVWINQHNSQPQIPLPQSLSVAPEGCPLKHL